MIFFGLKRFLVVSVTIQNITKIEVTKLDSLLNFKISIKLFRVKIDKTIV